MSKIELILGDCIEEMKKLPDGIIDTVICDIPYGTTNCKWDTIIPFEPMWEQLKRVTKDKAAIVLFGSQPFTSALIMSNPKMFKYEWIWDKVTARGHLLAKKRPMIQHENILVFSKGTHNYYPQMIDRSPDKYKVSKEFKRSEIIGGSDKNAPNYKTYTTWYPKTIITMSNADSSNKSIHPTQKPVALMEYLIKTYSNEGDTILDFTFGSGSTGVAAKNLNRNFIGIELDETYFEMAKNRINGGGQ